MASHDPGQSPRPRKNSIVKYAVSLVMLVAVIGGIAWVAQYLPSWSRQKTNGKPGGESKKNLLQFTRNFAQWTSAKVEPGSDDKIVAKDAEVDAKGFYDFPFKNIANEDVTVACYSSSCDCTNVQAVVIPGEEWEKLNGTYADMPWEPITYPNNTVFRDVIRDVEWMKLTSPARAEKGLVVKPGDGGVIRVNWHAKTAGAPLNVTPKIIFHATADDSRAKEQKLGVPVMVTSPVMFQPGRIVMDALTAGSSTKKEFFAYSSTRTHFDLKLNAGPNDALFHAEATPVRVGGIFSRSECGELLSSFERDKDKPAPVVRSAQRVLLTVYESRNNQYLDLGSYYRKLDVQLDGQRLESTIGPEVLGRVHGEINIGGADDQARVRLKSFNRRDGAIKTVELAADARWQLEWYKHEPSWLQVKLVPAKEQDDPKRKIWRLTVIVPENAPGCRSLEDPDSVMLKIAGDPVRFVRIPIEGQLGGP